jgi:hypothetical protein
VPRCAATGRFRVWCLTLAGSALLSTSIYVPVIMTGTGFTYRGLASHKITPKPGVYHAHPNKAKSRAAEEPAIKQKGEAIGFRNCYMGHKTESRKSI